MNRIEKILSTQNAGLYSLLTDTINEVNLLLGKYSANFPTYTDHSIEHVKEVFYLASELLTPHELENLNEDELYVLACACFLHDVGMCIPPDRIEELTSTENFRNYKSLYPESSAEDFLRNIHHELSHDFILKEWELLKIKNDRYAKAIALVAQGHRKVDLSNTDIYETKFFVKPGRDFVCLPYLASVLRVADELDVTNVRTPRLLTKYYMPNNEQSAKEWRKHIATTQVNFTEDKVLYEVICADQNIYAALQEQFEKIQSVLNYCQKIIRGIANTEKRAYCLSIREIKPNYEFMGFDPKGIRYSFDVQNVITAFIGDDLYDDKLVSIREAIQNSIDSCRYRKSVYKSEYNPKIRLFIESDKITIEDNGMGMDEFIIETFFGRLGSSFYEQEKIKSSFEAIGQFGVGVFSYFLLGEYIDIETKTDKSNALRFRIDKDPKNYFHFFGDTSRITAGTTITIFLKEEYKGKFTVTSLESYVSHVFRFIEFPIEISGNNSRIQIESQSFNIDYKKDVVAKFKMIKLEKESELKMVEVTLDNQNYKGQLAMIVSTDDKVLFESPGSLFDFDNIAFVHRHRHNETAVNFCQKGVFVATYETPMLSYIVGNIDLKKKIKINIDRSSFSDFSAVEAISREFELALLETINGTYFEGKNASEKVVLTEQLLLNYVESINDYVYVYKSMFEKMLHFNVYYQNAMSQHSLAEIFHAYESFGIVDNMDSAKEVSALLDKPVIVTAEGYYSSIYYKSAEIFKRMYNMNPSIYYNSGISKALIFDKNPNDIKELELGKRFGSLRNSIHCNSKEHIMVGTPTVENDSLYNPYFFNIDHPFLTKFVSYVIKYPSDSINSKIFKSIVEYLVNGHQPYRNHISFLRELNSLVAKLEVEYQYEFTPADFAITIPEMA